ncbi:hypothetical protein IMSAGC014_00575 [Bacteroidaceae bacterium]|nr:hypothetical protein IMSAGC014_00575 [Bacteroidaceae bacterium]
MKFGQDVNLLQMEKVCSLLLDRSITARISVDLRQEKHVSLFVYLVMQAVFGVHPFHHILQLFGTDNVTISGRKGNLRNVTDIRNVLGGGFTECNHVSAKRVLQMAELVSFFIGINSAHPANRFFNRKKRIGMPRAGSRLMVLQSLMFSTPRPAAAISTPPTTDTSAISSSEIKAAEICAIP